jgi:hypothetical protein
VTPRARYSFFIEDEQKAGLRAVKERDGIPEAEQIRRAIDEWLETKGVKPERKRAGTRKRS